MTSQGWRPGLVAAAATLFLSVVFFLGPLTDDDLSLHLGLGRMDSLKLAIGDKSGCVSGNQLSLWMPHEWWFSLGLWKLYVLTGTTGLVAARFIGWGLLLALLIHVGSPPFRGAFYYVALVTGLLAGAPLWTLRAHFVMLIGIGLTVLVARRPSPGWLRSSGLILFYLLWANTHASVFIGLGVWVLFRWSNWRSAPTREAGWLIALALVTLINPAGWRLLLWPLQFLGESKGVFVSEWGTLWSAPFFPHVAFFVLFTALIGFALARIHRERPFPWRELVLWGVFTLWAVFARRMVAPAVVAGLLALGTCAVRDRFWQRRDDKSVRDLVIILLLAISLLGSWWQPVGKRPFPDPALAPSLAAIRENPVKRQLFHPYEWGGLLLLEGQFTFIDGRTEAFSPKHLANYGKLYACGPGWEELLKQYPIDGIWLPPSAPLAQAVASDTGWMLQYSSPAAVYYLRR